MSNYVAPDGLARGKMPQLLATIFVQDQAYDDKLIKTSHLIKDEAPIMTNDRKDGKRSGDPKRDTTMLRALREQLLPVQPVDRRGADGDPRGLGLHPCRDA